MEVRWVKKDGEKVLQCRFVSTYHEEADKWVDVPVIVEEKTERKLVCDEIIDYIDSGFGKGVISDMIREKIKQIRDR